MKKVIFSLALGTFGLGMAEFGIMGVLTELARDVGISIPAAGHMISFYAFGVVLGAPIIAIFSNRFSLKHILLFLVTVCVKVTPSSPSPHPILCWRSAGWFPVFRTAHSLASGPLF